MSSIIAKQLLRSFPKLLTRTKSVLPLARNISITSPKFDYESRNRVGRTKLPEPKKDKDFLIGFGDYCLKMLPKYVQQSQVTRVDELELLICREGIVPVIYFLKNHYTSKQNCFIDLAVVDVPSRKYRFEVVYILLSVSRNFRIKVKTYTDEVTPLESICELFIGANWFEREAYDMFGIMFNNHPDLRRILTDYGFQGHPLRKDFPLMGYVEARFDSDLYRVVMEPLEMSQEYRKFELSAPWEQFPNFREPTETEDKIDEEKPK